MCNSRLKRTARTMLVLSSIGIGTITGIGCQTDMGGQTLPSAYFLEDDVQYYASGPEFTLTNQKQALERYKLQQQAIADGIDADIP